MAQAFFGLRPSDKPALHNQLFELVYYGKFVYSDLYLMPVYIKNFLYKKLIDTRQKEVEAAAPKSSENMPMVGKKRPKR